MTGPDDRADVLAALGIDDTWEARMSARAAERDRQHVRPDPCGRRPRMNGYGEWVWVCPHCTRPRWSTVTPTFVGTLKLARLHLSLLSWPTGGIRYDGHPVCLTKETR